MTAEELAAVLPVWEPGTTARLNFKLTHYPVPARGARVRLRAVEEVERTRDARAVWRGWRTSVALRLVLCCPV